MSGQIAPVPPAVLRELGRESETLGFQSASEEHTRSAARLLTEWEARAGLSLTETAWSTGTLEAVKRG